MANTTGLISILMTMPRSVHCLLTCSSLDVAIVICKIVVCVVADTTQNGTNKLLTRKLLMPPHAPVPVDLR